MAAKKPSPRGTEWWRSDSKKPKHAAHDDDRIFAAIMAEDYWEAKQKGFVDALYIDGEWINFATTGDHLAHALEYFAKHGTFRARPSAVEQAKWVQEEVAELRAKYKIDVTEAVARTASILGLDHETVTKYLYSKKPKP